MTRKKTLRTFRCRYADGSGICLNGHDVEEAVGTGQAQTGKGKLVAVEDALTDEILWTDDTEHDT